EAEDPYDLNPHPQ
nr:Chain D, Helicase SEN1 [Saccharomyces cerevisiae]6O3Y_E Chain E, Helicase SEN1 [Saccharomyces cerevisiae]6O3Y_F Chain F, Helicase SEN1 [Saccharomyces cerevisiae]